LSFVKVAKTSEIPPGKMKMVKLERDEVMIANVNGKYYAIGEKCTHYNGNLSRGTLSGNIITCPDHGAKFDITTGKAVAGPRGSTPPKIKDAPTYKVKVEGKDILISKD
jgi:nitrite reductase/ring-hydroxylating ferredoxin subunit